VTDHRINLTLYNLPQIIEGDIDDVINPLIAEDQAEQLRLTRQNIWGGVPAIIPQSGDRLAKDLEASGK
jgi:hypothetical protein